MYIENSHHVLHSGNVTENNHRDTTGSAITLKENQHQEDIDEAHHCRSYNDVKGK